LLKLGRCLLPARQGHIRPHLRFLASLPVGPDRLLPATSLTSTTPEVAVVRRPVPHPDYDYSPKSVWSMIQASPARCPDRLALGIKRDGAWVTWTYKQYLEEITTVAKAFIKLGLKPHHGVCIMGFNSPEWFISDIAAIVAGGLATGIYTTNSPSAVEYVARHCRANILVVADQEQLAKVLEVREGLPELTAIVQYDGKVTEPGVLSWADLLQLGRQQAEEELQDRLRNQAVNQACMVVYTSGTTGNPKGAMISQDNLTWTCEIAKQQYGWQEDQEESVTYLPLSHIAGNVIDIFIPYLAGGTVWFADKDALKGSLVNTLIEVRPTRFLGVPRVWEKIQEKLLEVGSKNTGLKKVVATWAKAASFEHHEDQMAGRPGNSWKYRLAKKVILTRVHAALGLERAARGGSLGGVYSSAAPLSVQTFQYFQALDLFVLEFLGSTETSGPMTACFPGTGTKQGSVGRGYPQFETAILAPQGEEGEIATRGRNCCMGYLWDEEKTRELIDAEGWLHSGDLGRMDQDGFFYITGRMKEIIITAGGENIAPVPIEDNIKADPGIGEVVSHAMVVGDARKHLAVILTLKSLIDENGQPLEELVPEVRVWLRKMGSTACTTREIMQEDGPGIHPMVQAAITEALHRVNALSVSKATRIHKFLLLPVDFSIGGGELTPTMKMRRHAIVKKYAKEVEDMYTSQYNNDGLYTSITV